MAASVAAEIAGLNASVSASSAVTRSAWRVARSVEETVARSAGTGNLAVASARAFPAVPLLFVVRYTCYQLGLEGMYLMVSSANVRAVALFPTVGSASAEGRANERRAMDMKRILIFFSRFKKTVP